MLGKLLGVGRKAWLGSVKGGVIGGRKSASWAMRVGKAAPGWAKGHPNTMYAGAVGAAGVAGYASSDGTVGQRLERGIGFATVAGLGLSSKFRGAATKQWKTADKAVGMYGFKKGLGAMGKRAVSGYGGTARMAAVGALYGAFDDDTSIIGGAVTGAGIGILGKGAARGIAAGKKIGMGTGAAAGGAIGGFMGGPVGMVGGAMTGGAIGGITAGYRRAGRAGKWGMRVAGGAAAGAVFGGAMIGSGVSNAYAMHQPGARNLGADGDLALGLHSMRHG